MKRINGGITAPCGFLAGGINCGIKKNSLDLCMVVSEKNATVAGCFTTNTMKAAPVLLCQQHIRNKCKAIVINSGCANACTGTDGYNNAMAMANITAQQFGADPSEILVCSTGRIGKQLPIDKFTAGIKKLTRLVNPDGNKNAAEAILTTDTFTKEYACTFTLSDGTQVTIGAMAKGAGMIEPDMATMLAFITTDAAVDNVFLKDALTKAVSDSFNKITVDGDTSTNDSVIIMANACAGNKIIDATSADAALFQKNLDETCHFLAMKILEDGEGATKIVKILLKGATDKEKAQIAAKIIANSLLLKVALNGNDVNWGRIIAALGRSKISLDPNKVDVYLNDIQIIEDSLAKEKNIEFSEKIWSKNRFKITIDLKNGDYQGECYTCDISHDYIDINL